MSAPIDTAVIRGAYSGPDDGWHLSTERVLALCDEIDRLRREWVALVNERVDLRARLADVLALCDRVTPPAPCLYADEGVDCESHCDCGWGEIWHESVRAILTGETVGF